MTKDTKLIIVVGQPGSRVDFVGGWIGTLPESFDRSWSISVNTGQSNGKMAAMMKGDANAHRESISTLLAKNSFVLDPESSNWLVITCHTLSQQHLDEIAQNDNSIIVALITTQNVPKHNLRWEFVVKTFFNRDFPKKLGSDEQSVIECQRLLRTDMNYQQCGYEGAIRLDYSRLFVQGGSHYLCDQLALAASDRHHSFWDHMLPFADAPNEIDFYGHRWCKSHFADG
jgi:hypothetical protein